MILACPAGEYNHDQLQTRPVPGFHIWDFDLFIEHHLQSINAEVTADG